jgi:hypothetical protein
MLLSCNGGRNEKSQQLKKCYYDTFKFKHDCIAAGTCGIEDSNDTLHQAAPFTVPVYVFNACKSCVIIVFNPTQIR